MSRRERPSAIEASFLALERSGFPMHVAGVVMVEGHRRVTLPELKHLAATRLRRLPRFGQRAESESAGRGYMWVPVERIDYSRHLFHHKLSPRAGKAQAFELCARIHEQPLDRDRPLWELHLVDGVGAGRQVLVVKTHHAISDGLAGIEIAEALFDPAPDKPRPVLTATGFGEMGGSSAMSALQGLVGLAFTAAGGPIAPEGPFNGPVGPRRAFTVATLKAEDIRDVKRETGGSFDDGLVAVVASGLGTYLRHAAYPAMPRSLKVMLPVSTRGLERRARLGNHVSAVFIDVPMGRTDLRALVQQIAASKATLRTSHAAAGGAMLVQSLGLLPPPFHSGVLRLASELPFANLVLSDIPGPEEPLFLLGRRVGACYPMMPLAPRVGLSIAAVNMAGIVGVGITSDPDLVPEPDRLASAIERVLPAARRLRVARAA